MNNWLRRTLAPKEESPANIPNPTAQAAANGVDPLAGVEQRLSEQLSEQGQQIAVLNETAAALEKHLERFSKEQFKANTLAESAVADAHAAVNVVRTAMKLMTAEERPAIARAAAPNVNNTRLIEALMPILDGIEAGLESGEMQLDSIPDEQAREMLSGWLEGQRLLRERLLALFDKEGVRPMLTVGRPFDPYRHVAVETAQDAERAPGLILSERRRGYEQGERVLRFAEVVVSAPS